MLFFYAAILTNYAFNYAYKYVLKILIILLGDMKLNCTVTLLYNPLKNCFVCH